MEKKICIVDHDLSSRGFLRECLEREGYQVTTVDSGFLVGPYLSEPRTDIFILNVDSPGVRDRGLLRELNKAVGAKILLIITERGDAFLKDAMDLGVYGFLHKPFNPNEICTMVHHLIR